MMFKVRTSQSPKGIENHEFFFEKKNKAQATSLKLQANKRAGGPIIRKQIYRVGGP